MRTLQAPIKLMLVLFAPLLLIANSAAPLSFILDASASSVSAKVPFFGISSKSAQFPKMEGEVTIVPGQPQGAVVDVTFDATELQAPDEVTLQRLRGEKFFWVEKYPTIRFVGSELTMKSPTTGTVKGQLTARGVTNAEELEVSFDTPPEQAAPGQAVNLTGNMTINRRDYGMRSYQLIVGNKVKISLRARMLPS